MVTFSTREEQDESFEREFRRLSALVADMDAIRHGASPEHLVAEEPPLLDRWLQGARFAPCLIGQSTGHPVLPGQDRLICTSELWLVAADQSWARTLSRWYRLGRPGGELGRQDS